MRQGSTSVATLAALRMSECYLTHRSDRRLNRNLWLARFSDSATRSFGRGGDRGLTRIRPPVKDGVCPSQTLVPMRANCLGDDAHWATDSVFLGISRHFGRGTPCWTVADFHPGLSLALIFGNWYYQLLSCWQV